MAELPRQSHGSERVAVTVLGGLCEHRWRGTVTVAGGRFTLDVDDSNCPECGGLAGTVLFTELGRDAIDG